jgi:hypothetical protein
MFLIWMVELFNLMIVGLKIANRGHRINKTALGQSTNAIQQELCNFLPEKHNTPASKSPQLCMVIKNPSAYADQKEHCRQ